MRSLTTIPVLFALVACNSSPKFMDVQNATITTDNSGPSAAIVAAHAETFDRCVSLMGETREGVVGSGKKEVGLAAIGIVAGSIVVPALAAKTSAAKSAIAAWGGVSGAANAAQYMLHQKGMSASAATAVYEQTRSEIRKANADYITAKNDQARLLAIMQLREACEIPALPKTTAPDIERDQSETE